jgi:hypothetical protein
MTYYTKLKKKTKCPIGPTSIRKGKFTKDIIQSMYHEVVWSEGCPDIVKDRGNIIRGCLCGRRVVPIMDAILSKPFIAFILSFLYSFFFLFISRSK